MATETNDKYELKTLTSWKELTEEGQSSQIDVNEDAWEFGAPPPHGVYDVKHFLAKDGIKIGRIDPKDPKSPIYITISMEGKIVNNEEFEGIPVFPRVNTRIYRGKSISTAAGFLVKCGYKVESPITDKKLGMMVEAALKKEPVVKVELDWRGSYQYQDKKGDTQYENVYNHYEEFPDNPEKPGTKKHIVTVNNSHTGGKVEVRAMLQVVRYFGKGDKIPVFNAGNKLVSAPQSAKPQLVQEETPTVQFAKSEPAPVMQQAAEDDGDVALLLEE